MESLTSSSTIFYILYIHTLHSTFIYFNTVFFIFKSQQYHPCFCIPTIVYYVTMFFAPVVSKQTGVLLLFLAAFFLKTSAYFIDRIVDRPIFVCCIFILVNIIVAFIDRFLKNIKVKEKCTGVFVLIDETPNYIFALVFGAIEQFSDNKMWPYVAIVSGIYTICGIFLINMNVEMKDDDDKYDEIDVHSFEKKYFKNQKNERDYWIMNNDRDIDQDKMFMNEQNDSYYYETNKTNLRDDLPKTIKKKSYKKTKKDKFLDLARRSRLLIYFLTMNNPDRALMLYFAKILCTITDILVYFFLVTHMPDQSFLIMYFSFDFLFKAVFIDLPDRFFYFFITGKFLLLIITNVSAILFYYGHYVLLLLVFVANGLTNQIVYKKFDKTFNRKSKDFNDFVIFIVVLWVVMWYARGKDGSFEDFMFFSSVRL